MITTDDYIKFVSNPILPAENKDEDLWFLFKDKMIFSNPIPQIFHNAYIFLLHSKVQ